MAGRFILQAGPHSCLASFPRGVKWVNGLVRLESRMDFGGLTLLGLFCNRCCWRLGNNSSCRIDKCPDKPSLHTGGFLISTSFPYPSYFLHFPRSPDQNNILYHSVKIDVPYSVKSWVPYLRVCAFIRLACTAGLQARDFPRVSGYPCDESVNPSYFRSGRRSFVPVVFCLRSVCRSTLMEG